MTAKPRSPKTTSGKGKEGTTATDEQAFPAGVADELVSIAAYVGWANEVKAQTDLARKMRPNEQAILAVAEKWYKAAEDYTESRATLSTAVIELGIYWSGAAYDAFSTHMSNVDSVADNHSTQLNAIGNSLVDVYNYVVEQYHGAIGDIATTYKQVSGIDPKNHAKTLIDTFSTFVTGMKLRRESMHNALANEQGKMTAIHGEIMQLLPGPPVPRHVTDKAKWQYSP